MGGHGGDVITFPGRAARLGMASLLGLGVDAHAVA
jgi:hypothetical protein